MPNRNLNKILDTAPKSELVDRVKVRMEGDHFRVTSGRGWHTIRYAPDGTPFCSCEDWVYNQEGRPLQERCCKHLAAMAEMGVLVLKPGQKERWQNRKYRDERERSITP